MVESAAQNNVEEQQQQVVETKTCNMCEKPIEVAKYRLHEVACSRQNFKCAKCGEVVPKSDREQHELDVHTEKPDITCDLCQQFTSKDLTAIETHKKDECQNRPQPVMQQPVAAAGSSSSGGALQKCPYCPMEFTADQVQSHISYCGSKTKECPDCFTTVQAWMLNSHKETGECANIVLDRQEADDQNQIRKVMEESAFASGPSAADFAQRQEPSQPSSSSVQAQQQQPMAAPVPVSNDGMDENEREIARILQEEANAIDGGNNAAAMGNQFQQQQQQQFNNDNSEPQQEIGGIRAPDASRMQVLSGPDPYYGDHADIDYDLSYAREQQRQQQQRINDGLVTGIQGGIMNAASSVATGFRSLLGYNNEAQQPLPNQEVQHQQLGGDADGMGMSEDERQMQLAMAASMGVETNNSGVGGDPNAQVDPANPMAEQNPPASQVVNHPVQQNAEEEAMARAIQESMSAERSDLAQIQAQNNLYQEQMAGGFEDEDAMLARALAESENQQ